jgi:hypothetical protein
MELEVAGLLVEDARSGDIPRQQVGSALETPEAAAQSAGERLGEQRPVPGTSSSRRCPSANRQLRTSSRIGRLP